MSIFAVPAREATYSRGLKTSRAPLVEKKPAWRLDVIEDVVLEAAREGAAITVGQILVLEETTFRPLEWEDPMRKRADFLGITGPSTWACRREAAEPWNEFVKRSASHAIEQVRELTASSRFGALAETLFVDLAWVTTDELDLFDLPAMARAALRATLDDGAAFRPGSRSRRVAMALPTLGSFHGLPAQDIDAIPGDARYAFLRLDGTSARTLPRLQQLETLEVHGAPDRSMPFLNALENLRVLSTGDVRIKSLELVRDLRRLAVLRVGVCRQLQDWGALERMRDLRTLEIGELWLTDLTPITAARGLRGLHLYVPRAVSSLAPLAMLQELRALRFWGGSADQSLLPLSSLRDLRTLELRTSSFKLEAFAELAVALPNAEGPHRSPFKPAVGWQQQIVRCARCGGAPEFYTLGKPTRMLCRTCDSARIAKYVSRWEILVSAARARHAAIAPS